MSSCKQYKKLRHSTDGANDDRFRCSVCRQKFKTSKQLMNHIAMSTGKCAVKKDLLSCPHCFRTFATTKGLDHHIRMTEYCRFMNDPPTLSDIGFTHVTTTTCTAQSNAIVPIDLLEYSSSVSAQDMESLENCQNSRSNDVTVSTMSDPKKKSTAFDCSFGSKSFSIEDLSMFLLGNRGKQNVCGVSKSEFYKFCSIPEVQLSLDINYLINDPSLKLSREMKFISNLVLAKTPFTNPSICASFNILVMEIMNSYALATLNGTVKSIPGYTSLTTSLSKEDVKEYLFRYSQLWLTKEFPDKWCAASTMPEYSLDEDLTLDNFVNLVDEHSDTEDASVFDDEESNMDAYDQNLNDDSDSDNPTEVLNEVIDKVMKTHQENILKSQSKSVYNDFDIANIELYQMLKSSGAPAYLFDQIQDWASKHCSKIMCNNGKKLQRRKTFIENMSKKVYGNQFSELMKPALKKLQLPSGNTIDVIVCSFKAQLISLLTDTKLMKSQNLLLNPDDPFSEVPDGILAEVNTGWWFNETRREICTVPNKHILLPIIIFLDASNVDKNGRLQVNPLTFTLGIFKRAVRNTASAWRTMGYVDELLNFHDKDVRKDQKKSSKVQDIHAIISLVINELREIQGKQGGFEWRLDLGGKTYDVVFKIAVQTIIGDCKGNDLLCGRYGSHGIQVKRLCRDCDVLTMSGDQPDHVCTFISKNDIENKSHEEMKDLSFHCIENAFCGIYFGARNTCITEATPPEPLHGFKLGICKYLFEGFESQCPKETMRLINFTIMRIAKYSSRSSLRNMPCLQAFKRKGLSKCHTLSADEQYARIFGLFLCLNIPHVLESLAIIKRKEINQVLLPNGRTTSRFEDVPALGFRRANQWLELITDTVVFNSWIMNDQHARHDLDHRQLRHQREFSLEREPLAQKMIRSYMKLFKRVVCRDIGNGLCIPKYHQLLHYTRQILKDGSLLNIDGGRCESIAIENHTNPGKRTQMRYDSFLFQLSNHYHSDMVINSAEKLCKVPYGKLTLDDSSTVNEVGFHMQPDKGSRFLIELNTSQTRQTDRSLHFVWQGKTPKYSFPKEVCSALGRRLWFNTMNLNCLHRSSIVKGFTEYYDGEHMYRAHPSFRDDGEWYDWCYIAWDENDDPVPSKILMFVDLRTCTFINDIHQNDDIEETEDPIRNHPDFEYLKNEMYVLIQSCLEDFEDNAPNSRFRKDGPISKRVRLESTWRIIPVEAIAGPAFVIPEDITQKQRTTVEHFIVNPKQSWSDKFLKR